jgi:hypothetical protein
LPDAELVAIIEHGVARPAAVDERGVQTSEIDEPPAIVDRNEATVVPRDRVVGDDDIRGRIAAEDELAGMEAEDEALVNAAYHDEMGHLRAVWHSVRIVSGAKP